MTLLAAGLVVGLLIGGLLGYLLGKPADVHVTARPEPSASPFATVTPIPTPAPSDTAPAPASQPAVPPPSAAPSQTASTTPSAAAVPCPAAGQPAMPALLGPDGAHRSAGLEWCGAGPGTQPASAIAIAGGSALAVSYSCPPNAASQSLGGQAIVVSEMTAQGQPGPDQYRGPADPDPGTKNLTAGDYNFKIEVAAAPCQWHAAVYPPR